MSAPTDTYQAPHAAGLARVLADIVAERSAQNAEWGGPAHDDSHSPLEWAGLVQHHLERLGRELVPAPPKDRDAVRARYQRVRRRLLVIAALGAAAIESLDRLAEDDEIRWADLDMSVAGDHLHEDHE